MVWMVVSACDCRYCCWASSPVAAARCHGHGQSLCSHLGTVAQISVAEMIAMGMSQYYEIGFHIICFH